MIPVIAEVVRSIKNVTGSSLSPILISSAILSGVLYGLSFPPFGFSFLAWICLIPLLTSQPKKPKQFFLSGFIGGLVANLIIFFWIWKTFQAAGVGFATTFLAWVALSVILALYWGVFYFLYGSMLKHPFKIWVAPFIWVSLDFIRGIILTGFPWAYIGHSQFEITSLIQIVSVFGVSGLTYLIILTNVILASLFLAKNKNRKNYIPLFILLVLLVKVVAWGQNRLKNTNSVIEKNISVSLLQGNIDQYLKWDVVYENKIKKTYRELALKAAEEKPDVIIWPESSLPGWYPNEALVKDWVENLILETGRPHLVGAVTRQAEKDYNAVFSFDSKARAAGFYAKMRLVPFGEYVPFGGLLANVIPFLGELGVFAAGENPLLFKVNHVWFAPNICYEAVFPSLVRKTVKQGGQIIVNLTNDGWYLDTGAPEQHFMTNIFRAIENGRSVVRVANTGISAVIDPWGRVLNRTKLMEKTVLTSDVPVVSTSFETLYLKWGAWFDWFSLIWVLFYLWVLYTPSHVQRTKRKN